MSLARGIDPFTVGLFSTTAFMLLVAVFVVMEFATIVTGPDDLSFYAPLPVPPVAYVSAKIGVTCLFGLAFARGLHPARPRHPGRRSAGRPP